MENKQSIIWSWARGLYKVYVEDAERRQKIARWKDAKQHCEYFYLNGNKAWDFIIPSKLHDRVAKLMGLPLRSKNGNRVKAGKRLEKHNFRYRYTEVKS